MKIIACGKFSHNIVKIILVLTCCSYNFHAAIFRNDEITCGSRSKSLGKRMIGGVQSAKCEFPWMVSLRIRGETCGGSILDDQHILTAAHCLVHPDTYVFLNTSMVVAGVGSSNLKQQKVFKVASIHFHEQYKAGKDDYDVAVLKLERKMKFSECVQPICLPNAWQKLPETFQIAGWGSPSFLSFTTMRDPLFKVTVPLVSNDLCAGVYYFMNISLLHVCAGNYTHGGVDACQNDSGGPLMAEVNHRYIVFGIISTGRDCGMPEAPGIYTRVTHDVILKFIKTTIGRKK